MFKIIKPLIILLAALTMTGCRTAKPTAETYEVKEIAETTTDSSSMMRFDSVSVAKESECREWKTLRFVEGGGCVTVDSAGAVSISGVTTIRTSRLESVSAKAELRSSELNNQINETDYSEMESAVLVSKAENATKNGFSKDAALISVFIITFIIIIVFRIWRNLRK